MFQPESSMAMGTRKMRERQPELWYGGSRGWPELCCWDREQLWFALPFSPQSGMSHLPCGERGLSVFIGPGAIGIDTARNQKRLDDPVSKFGTGSARNH